jgi:pimeloyl-ACP methyl ester carboxylesterase
VSDGPDAARPTLVLLHAFPVWSALYDDVRERLAAAYDLLTPDLPGWGDAPLPTGEPALDAYADLVAELLDSRGVQQAVVGGTSMGGYVALAFARRHGDRLSGLVLVDTKASADTDAARDNRERIARTALEEGGPRVLLDDVLPALLGETSWQTRPEVVDLVRGWVEQARPEAVAWTQRAMAARPDSFDTLRELRVPALVVVGEEDRLTPPDDARAMHDVLPDGALVVVPRAGHLSAVEAPQAVATAVVAEAPRLAP